MNKNVYACAMDILADSGSVTLKDLIVKGGYACGECYEVLRRLYRDGVVIDDGDGVYKVASDEIAQQHFDILNEHLDISVATFSARTKGITKAEYDLIVKIKNGGSVDDGERETFDGLVERSLCYEFAGRVYCELDEKQIDNIEMMIKANKRKSTSAKEREESPQPKVTVAVFDDGKRKQIKGEIDEAIRRYTEKTKPTEKSVQKEEPKKSAQKKNASKPLPTQTVKLRFVNFGSIGEYKVDIHSRATVLKAVEKAVEGMLPTEEIECLGVEVYSKINKPGIFQRKLKVHLYGKTGDEIEELCRMDWSKSFIKQMEEFSKGGEYSEVYAEITERDEIAEELENGLYPLRFVLYGDINEFVGECEFSVSVKSDVMEAVEVALHTLHREIDKLFSDDVDGVLDKTVDESIISEYKPVIVTVDENLNEKTKTLQWHEPLFDEINDAVMECAKIDEKAILRLVYIA